MPRARRDAYVSGVAAHLTLSHSGGHFRVRLPVHEMVGGKRDATLNDSHMQAQPSQSGDWKR
jgi:hypothetical protein